MKLYSGLTAVMQHAAEGRTGPVPFENAATQVYAASSLALVIVELNSLSILEVNDAAAGLFDFSRRELLGGSFLRLVHPSDTIAIQSVLQRLPRGAASARVIDCTSRDGASLRMKLSLVRSGTHSFVLALIDALGATSASAAAAAASGVATLDLLDDIADGFVVADLGLRIDFANRRFGEMVGQPSGQELQGQSLARWLDLSQCDVSVLVSQLSKHEAVQEFTTSLRRPAQAPRLVQVCAIGVPAERDACWGFRIRDLPCSDGAFVRQDKIKKEQTL